MARYQKYESVVQAGVVRFETKHAADFRREHILTAVLPTSVFMVRSCLPYRAAAGANHHIWCPAWGRLVSCRAPTIPWSFSSVFSVQF